MQALMYLFKPKGISTAIRAISAGPVDKIYSVFLSYRVYNSFAIP